VNVVATATSTGLRRRLEEVVGGDHVRTDEGALVTFSTASAGISGCGEISSGWKSPR